MMDGEELDAIWERGYDAAYRNAIEVVKQYLPESEDKNSLIEEMMDDWRNS